MRIAVFLPNWVGDAVMATPALRALRKKYCAAEITGIMRPVVADTLAGLDVLDYELLHDPRSRDRSLRSTAVIRAMRPRGFDLAVLFPNSLRTGWMSFFGGAKRRCGFARDARRLFLNDSIRPTDTGVPTSALTDYLVIAEHLECDVTQRTPELALLPDDQAGIARFWSKHPRQAGRPVVVLNSGGAFGAAKDWPLESFAELARRIATEHDAVVLVVCGPAERRQARQIAALSGDSRVLSLADETPSVGLTKAAIASASLLVTTDSGPRHFGHAFGVPTVTLYGPTDERLSETWHPQGIAVRNDIECRPCQQRVCPLGHHRCMRNLDVSTVAASVAPFLRNLHFRSA